MTKLLEEARRQYLGGRPDLAEATLRKVLAQNPKETQALLALGMIAVETGRPEVAIGHLNAALQIDPAYGPALCWMSFLQLQARRIEDARGFAERAVAADPRNAAAHVALGRSLLELGSAGEAIRHFQVSVDLNPNEPGALYEFADVLIRASLWFQAAEALKRAVSIAPLPIGFLKLAYAEHRLGKIEDAERDCRRALQADPNAPDAHLEMARILTSLHKSDEADIHWRRADELDPKPGFVNFERALALSAIGRLDDATKDLERSIELKPNQGDAYQALVYNKKVSSEDEALVGRMEALLDKRVLPEPERLSLLYALGKATDGLGQYERAIGFFDRANSLRAKLAGAGAFDKAAFTAMIDAKIALFSDRLFEEWKQFRSESALPLLIVGMMRSGTTLVEQVLTCHPQVAGAGEQHYWGENETIDPERLRYCAGQYVELLSSIAPDFPFVIDKNPANLQVLGSFHLAFPNARMIYVRRNAIDTALSIWMTPMRTSADFIVDRESIVFGFKEFKRLMDHWHSVIPSDRLLEVRYEDLVTEPEIHIRRMVEFCGLEWNEACLHPELNKRRVITPSVWQVRQPIYRSSAEKWKNYEPWLGVFEELRSM